MRRQHTGTLRANGQVELEGNAAARPCTWDLKQQNARAQQRYRERQKTKSSDMQVLLDEKEAQLESLQNNMRAIAEEVAKVRALTLTDFPGYVIRCDVPSVRIKRPPIRYRLHCFR